jgi:hypothetical protein
MAAIRISPGGPFLEVSLHGALLATAAAVAQPPSGPSIVLQAPTGTITAGNAFPLGAVLAGYAAQVAMSVIVDGAAPVALAGSGYAPVFNPATGAPTGFWNCTT